MRRLFTFASIMFLAKTPTLIQFLLPSMIWKMSGTDKSLYLTFDDGPIPEITPWVLETLDQYQAKATFFCVGDNVRKHPEIYSQLIQRGHATGNHTFNHLNGWTNHNDHYLENVNKCRDLVSGNLFRPPYGRISPKQFRQLKKEYQIVMWDVLSGDFSANLKPEVCLNNVLRNAKAGSIIVMHDSLKAEKNLRYMLPKILDFYSESGYTFKSIPQSISNANQ